MSRQAAILLAAGTDRPGIVDRISGEIFGSGCNLEDSRMSILGGEFALMVLVTGATEQLESARERLQAVARELELILEVKPTAMPGSSTAEGDTIAYRLHAVSLDHPGIVHKIARFLRERSVNVARLDSSIQHAPTTGAPVFSLELEAHVPAGRSIARLRAELSKLAEDENIDITLAPID